MEVLHVFLTVMSFVVAAPVAVFCIQIVAGCWPQRKRGSDRPTTPRPRVAVLVPAHNEEAGIAATLRSIQAQLLPGDRVVVVADNCSDKTAAVARELNATVLERSDDLRRGKGFALAFGLDYLAAGPPEVVLFFDADCRLGPGTIELLVRQAQERHCPVQALYLCQPTAEGSHQQLLGSLAFRFRNQIRMAGMARLGGACHLTGSGMGLPWELVDKVAWATGNVVEDMQLGIDYTLAGYPPVFVPDATILSELPTSEQGLLAQRRRWEHGFLQTALSESPRLFTQSVERRSWPLLLSAIDLTVPPLALLTMALTAAWCAAALIWCIGLGAGPLTVVAITNTAFGAATLLGWYVHCRDLTPLSFVLKVPSYLLAKVPLYLDFINRRQQQWNRAERAVQ